MINPTSPRRIGIYSGTFDPVHKGHIAFALQASEVAALDQVAFVPEPKPRGKASVTHIGHRSAMIKLAIAGHKRLELLELPDKQFDVAKTMPRLQAAFPGARLVYLIGSDILEHISVWPMARRLLEQVELVVAVRSGKDEHHANKLIGLLPQEPIKSHIVLTQYQNVSSSDIRSALSSGAPSNGELASVVPYISQHWLYRSLNANNS